MWILDKEFILQTREGSLFQIKGISHKKAKMIREHKTEKWQMGEMTTASTTYMAVTKIPSSKSKEQRLYMLRYTHSF